MLALVIVFLVFLLINTPIAFVIGGAGIAWFVASGRSLDVLAQYVTTQTQSIAFLAVPFFIFAGNLMNRTGITRNLINFSRLLTRRMELADACHAQGISVGLETNLNTPFDEASALLAKADVLMCDLKLFDGEEHRRWTGVHNAVILENIRRLDSLNIPYIVRTPVIPGATDSDENIAAIANYLKPWGGYGLDAPECKSRRR